MIITILNNGIALISSDNRREIIQGGNEQGHIYSYDLNQENPVLIPLTSGLNFEFHPHGISVYEKENDEAD